MWHRMSILGWSRRTPQWLRRKISRLPATPPITEEFERVLAARGDGRRKPWFTTQKEHWLGWLAEYDGPGFYRRKTWKVEARAVYNRVVNPAMLVWLAEASGVDDGRVRRAVQAALDAPPAMAAQSGAIRREIPWEVIEERLR